MRRAAEWRTRLPGDPVTYVVGVAALVVFALHGFQGRLSRDLAVYAYAGQQVADGVPPYEGIMNRAGPLAHMVPAIGVGFARLGGFGEILGMRLVFLAVSVACVCLIYVLGRTLFASRLAGLAASAALLSFAGFIEYASNGPREKTVMVAFLLGTLLAMTGRRWFTAGVRLCLATLTWQPVFIVGLAAIAVALLAEPRDRWLRAIGRLAAGLLVPAVVCVVYFAIAGALRAFIDGFLLINLRYTEASSFFDRPGSKWGRLIDGYGLSTWVLVAGLVALTAVAIRVLIRGQRREPASISVIAVGLAGIVSVAWTLRNFNGWPDAFLALPFAAIGIGGLAEAVGDYLRPRATVLVTSAWVAVAVVLALTYSIGARSHGLDQQRHQVAMIREEIPGATFLSIEAPQPLVISGMTNPTRYQMFRDGLDRYVHRHWRPGGLAGFADWIGQQAPTVISIGRHGVPRWLRDTIHREYRYAGEARGWTCYVNRSVDPAVVAEVKAHLKRGSPSR
jgi:4-amino-4-deoxy-L-arabinose transferase-like glycosyltransferase